MTLSYQNLNKEFQGCLIHNMDSLTKEKRSWNMSHIKGKDTKYEILVRKALFAEGFRFRKNVDNLPGKPDIVLSKYKTVVFINGCFWHQHANCPNARIPKSNVDFWKQKLFRNVENDTKKQALLCQDGWNVVILWECELKKDFDGVIHSLFDTLRKSA